MGRAAIFNDMLQCDWLVCIRWRSRAIRLGGLVTVVDVNYRSLMRNSGLVRSLADTLELGPAQRVNPGLVAAL